jgi:hypothetical protein
MAIHEGFTEEEWRGELRRALQTCANEDGPLTFYIDEYKMMHDHWYEDLECLVRSNTHTDICKQDDVFPILMKIKAQIAAEKRGMRIGLPSEYQEAEATHES